MFLNIVSSAFTGDLTTSWRESHRRELEAAAQARDKSLGKVKNKVTITIEAPEHRRWQMQVERGWIKNQLSEFQGLVWDGMKEWKGTLIPSEHLGEFAKTWPLEHLESTHEQILRALNQLAGMGLIAKISVRNQEGEYLTGYRGFREEEFPGVSDIKALQAGGKS